MGGNDRFSKAGRYLFLKASRDVAITLVSFRERKRRQPGLAVDDPAFIAWLQLVGRIQGSQVHFNFICGTRENGRAAAGTEKPPGVVACFAIDRHRILREYRRSVKKCPMMFAAVETVTNTDAVWASCRDNSNVATTAAARESIHPETPLNSSCRYDYNDPGWAFIKEAPAFAIGGFTAVGFTASRKTIEIAGENF